MGQIFKALSIHSIYSDPCQAVRTSNILITRKMKILLLLLVTIYTASVAHGELVHTDKGISCSNRGFMDLSTEQECKDAVSFAKSFNSEANYLQMGYFSYLPRGCFIDDYGWMYFNADSIGKRSPVYTSICKKEPCDDRLPNGYKRCAWKCSDWARHGACNDDWSSKSHCVDTPSGKIKDYCQAACGNCNEDDGCFDVKLTTVNHGSEISWRLGSCQSNGGYGNNAEYTEQCCLTPGNYNLECKDSYGDGWNGGYIEVKGEKYCESFSIGREETVPIVIEGNEQLWASESNNKYCRANRVRH